MCCGSLPWPGEHANVSCYQQRLLRRGEFAANVCCRRWCAERRAAFKSQRGTAMQEKTWGEEAPKGGRDDDQARRRALRHVDEECKNWFERTITDRAQRLVKIYILELLFRQKPLPRTKDGRHIPLRPITEKPLQDERRGRAYVSNSIRSARYTPWDFLPKQFFFQCTRLNNLYFIAIGIPQAIPGISTTGNYTTILPVIFFICLTVAKEGYDDYRRHRLDKVENNSWATVLKAKSQLKSCDNLLESWVEWLLSVVNPVQRRKRMRSCDDHHDSRETDCDEEYAWTQVKWKNIQVGDILRLQRDEPAPADIALLHASGEHGAAYIDTAALDGETSLKTKQAPTDLQSCCSISGLKSTHAEFVAEDPNRNLYDFNGRITLAADKTLPLTLNEVIYRGSVLRNTHRAVGVVINTGEECKIRMNANHHPRAKKPRLERQSNKIVITLIFYVVILSVGCSMGYVLWHHDYEVNAWYLNDSYVNFRDIFIGFLIMFNNVIPLALYISLEIVKVSQMLMIQGDVEMYDEASRTPMACNTNTILENLGQVSYVLSDKTGTLTENVMRFRKMSIAGIAWSHNEQNAGVPCSTSQSGGKPAHNGEQQSHGGAEKEYKTKSNFLVTDRKLSDSSASDVERPRPQLVRRQSSGLSKTERSEVEFSTTELVSYIQGHPDSAFSKLGRDFILAMALCHTALPEVDGAGVVDFQASSPDELALVRAAQELGFIMLSRSSQFITLLVTDPIGQPQEQIYEILDVVEFSSKRKRMSIIVRRPDGRIWLLCKGADTTMMPRLKNASLAARKSHEVRRSMRLERNAQRRSEQAEPRNSFGARPSMTMRQKSSMEIGPIPRRTASEVPKVHQDSKMQACSRGNVPQQRDLEFLENASILDDSLIFSRCFRHIDEFATQGLRTLFFAHKVIPAPEYEAWKESYVEATTSLTNRQEKIEAAGEVIEQGLDLLGASAIEDKLQKDVPETISKLRRANIKIWMLTGDKRETAINIAHSTQICEPDSEMHVLDVSQGDLEEQMRSLALDIRAIGGHTVAVIDGQTLAAIDNDPLLKHHFYALIPLLDSVICCRASPAQKAGIVKAIRARVHGALTLAIGDGANDIAMIQASHVGVGISGKEGLQAARVADYSIAQFRFLQRLLLVHGRWSYVRTAKFVLWTFFKEFFFYMMQAVYQRYNGYTGTSLYENWSLTVLNTLFTSLCVIIPGVFEQDLSAETLLALPELYVYGQRNKGLNVRDYLLWMLCAAAEGIIVWFVTWAAYGLFNDMSDNGLFAIGDLCFSLGIAWQNVKLLLIETHHKTAIVIFSFTITFGGWWAWNGFMSGVYSSNLSPYDVRGGFKSTFGNDLNWWLTFIIVMAILVVPELAYKSVRGCLLVAGAWPPWKRGWWRKRSRMAEELDVGLWQEMEKDRIMRDRLQRMAHDENRGDDIEGQD